MGRYRGPKEKIERRVGEKLFLKGERSYSPKSAMVKRPYPPGMHGKKGFRRISEYGQQLQKKQKVRFIYGLMEKQFKSYVKKALKTTDQTNDALIQLLEQRLDNAVFRMGLAQSRNQARQLVTHGHILVNSKRVNIPSYQTRKGDVIEVREGSKNTAYFSSLVPQWIEKHNNPEWMKVDKKGHKAEITGIPTLEESEVGYRDIQSIIELYSR